MIINSYGPVNTNPEVKKKKKWLFFEKEGKKKRQVKKIHNQVEVTHCPWLTTVCCIILFFFVLLHRISGGPKAHVPTSKGPLFCALRRRRTSPLPCRFCSARRETLRAPKTVRGATRPEIQAATPMTKWR